LETCEEYHKEGEMSSFTPGKAAGTKNRNWVVIKGNGSLEDLWEKTKDMAEGTVCAAFDTGNFALIYKDKNLTLTAPEGHQLLAPTDGRMGYMKAYEIAQKFFKTTFIANLKLKDRDDALPDFDQITDYLADYDKKKLNQYTANAKIAKKTKTCTPMQTAVLACVSEVQQFVAFMEKSNQMIYSVTEGFQYPRDFASWLPLLLGVYWCARTQQIKQISLVDCIDKTNMYLKNLICFVGLNGRGKSELIRAIAKRLSKAHGFDKYCFGKSLDPVGCMTKSGSINECGAVALTDLDLVSLMNTPLSLEHKKGLMKVEEAAHYAARYGEAILPKLRPRILAVNATQNRQGIQWSGWFEAQGLEACAALAAHDAGAFRACSDEQQAVARNITIFRIDNFAYDQVANAIDTNEAQQHFMSRIKDI